MRTVGTTTTANGHTYFVIFENGKEHPYASYRDTAEEVIINDLFPCYAWPGGYDMEFITPEGDVLCCECARNDYRDDPDEGGKIEDSVAESSMHSTGLMCDQCNEWIIAPHCVDCADELDDVQEKGRTIFHDETGSYLVCSHCLACAVVKDRAHKTGKRSYRVTGEWYTGSYSSPQE
jgi:hypothetical protein